jgi:hypothetical protein
MIHQISGLSAPELAAKTKPFKDGYIVYSCGSRLSRYAVRYLMEHKVKPVALCDSREELWGKALWNYFIISPEEAARQFADKDVLMVLALDGEPFVGKSPEEFQASEVFAELDGLGFKDIAYINE